MLWGRHFGISRYPLAIPSPSSSQRRDQSTRRPGGLDQASDPRATCVLVLALDPSFFSAFSIGLLRGPQNRHALKRQGVILGDLRCRLLARRAGHDPGPAAQRAASVSRVGEDDCRPGLVGNLISSSPAGLSLCAGEGKNGSGCMQTSSDDVIFRSLMPLLSPGPHGACRERDRRGRGGRRCACPA